MKKVSIIDVAKSAGVSKSTVSRVLNNSYGISFDAKEKVLKAVNELKYKPNMSARDLRGNTSRLIGILISEKYADIGISHYVNSKKISGIVNGAKQLGYDVLIFIEDVNDRERLLNIIREKNLSGIVMLNNVPLEVLDSFNEYGVPFVLVNWFEPGYSQQCYVKTDLSKAVVLALDYLTGKGYHDIGVINWEDATMGEPVIENTFNLYMKNKGLKYKGCVWNTVFDISYQDVCSYVNSSKKRAYISFSYPASIDILKYCFEKGIRVPEEVALISYEHFDFFDYLRPQLSGIKQPAEPMGEVAAEKLIGIINEEEGIKSEMLEPELVIRESS